MEAFFNSFSFPRSSKHPLWILSSYNSVYSVHLTSLGILLRWLSEFIFLWSPMISSHSGRTSILPPCVPNLLFVHPFSLSSNKWKIFRRKIIILSFLWTLPFLFSHDLYRNILLKTSSPPISIFNPQVSSAAFRTPASAELPVCW